MATNQLSKEHKEVLLDLHLTGKPIPPLMRTVLKGLVDKVGSITREGVKVVHAYAEEKNKRQWLDK